MDILSSILLRTFPGSPSSTVNALYEQVRSACLDSSIEKIVLMSHGTGGIIISIVLDRLLADLPAGKDCLGKIEIYTFGNATGWMSNPNQTLRNPLNANGHAITNGHFTRRKEEDEKTISHIEHYAMENDILARWGILHNMREVLDNRYAGRVFVMNGKTSSGLMRYLDHIWPICHEERCDFSGKSCSNTCHIHSDKCEIQGGCGNNCNDHTGRNECGIKGCKSQGIVCETRNCLTTGHKMVCMKLCPNEPDCDHPKECQTHGQNCTDRHPEHHHHPFLDQVVDVDIDTAVKREFTAQKSCHTTENNAIKSQPRPFFFSFGLWS